MRTVVDCVGGQTSYKVAGDALYYDDCSSGAPALHRLDLSSGRDEMLGTPAD